jgi:L-threonylcarbamoyladenylate synthase
LTDPFERAVERLEHEGLVGYPTETVWGLGADASSALAVDRLRRFKGRPADKPLPVLVTGLAALEKLVVSVSPLVRELAEAFWPGPLTLVLPSPARLAPGVARSDGGLGVRCSAHPVASELAARLEREGRGPLTATSLNRSGEPPAATRAEAAKWCGVAIAEPLLLETGPDAGGESPSTVLDLTGPYPEWVRRGPLATDLERWLRVEAR